MPDPDRPVALLFDWGDTLMRDDPTQPGPMAQWPEVAALPGAREALIWARGIGQVGIASGAADSGSADIRAALARVGLDGLIDFIFCRREIGADKTDPRFWQAILAQLGLPPQQVVMIGDSYTADIAPAQAAGLYTFWLNSRNLPPRPTTATIHALSELPQRFPCDLVK